MLRPAHSWILREAWHDLTASAQPRHYLRRSPPDRPGQSLFPRREWRPMNPWTDMRCRSWCCPYLPDGMI